MCFALASVLDVVVGAKRLGEVLGGGLLNPDSYMRLVRLADTLRAGAPVDAVARDQSGAGFVLHWSHLLDMLLLLLAAPLQLLFPARQLLFPARQSPDWPLPPALHWAAVASGPLAVGALATAVVWAVAPYAARGWRWLAALALPMALPVAGYGIPGVVHHHILLAVAAVMAAGWAVRAATLGAPAGWRTGLWAGVGIWLSPETMPFSLMAIGGIGVAWLLTPANPQPGRALLAAGPGFLLVVGLAFAVDPGAEGWWASALDRVSWLFIGLALAVCAIGLGAHAIDRAAPAMRLRVALAAALTAVALGAWLAAFPAVLRGPEGIIADPRGAAFWTHISEMLPVDTVADFCRFLLGGALATALAVGLALRRRSLVLGYLALCAAATLVFGAQHHRFATYDAAMAAAALPVAMTLLSRWPGALAGMVARLACLAAFLMLPFLPELAGTETAEAGAAPDCRLAGIARLLAPFAGQVVLADVDDTPELLFRSGVLTVGSLYPRAFPGFARALEAWRSPASETEPAAVRATKAALVLACPGRPRSRLVLDLPPDTLFDQLNAGAPPPWLAFVGKDGASGRVLYRVR